jgi:hypothetical protein
MFGTGKLAREYTFFSGRGTENHEIGTRLFLHKIIISAIKRVKYGIDRMPYILLRGHWCHIVLNVHAPAEENIDDVKENLYEELECVFDKFPKYYVKMEFNAEVDGEDVFKPINGNESLREVSNDNGVRVVIFATSKISFKSMMFPHISIHKHT